METVLAQGADFGLCMGFAAPDTSCRRIMGEEQGKLAII